MSNDDDLQNVSEVKERDKRKPHDLIQCRVERNAADVTSDLYLRWYNQKNLSLRIFVWGAWGCITASLFVGSFKGYFS